MITSSDVISSLNSAPEPGHSFSPKGRSQQIKTSQFSVRMLRLQEAFETVAHRNEELNGTEFDATTFKQFKKFALNVQNCWRLNDPSTEK